MFNYDNYHARMGSEQAVKRAEANLRKNIAMRDGTPLVEKTSNGYTYGLYGVSPHGYVASLGTNLDGIRAALFGPDAPAVEKKSRKVR